MSRPTKWAGTPCRYKTLGKHTLDTIVTGHLTQEQIDAYQNHFRIEEISALLRTSQQQHKDVTTLLPSSQIPNYRRDPLPPPKYDNYGNRTNTREARTRAVLEKERHFLVEAASTSIKDYVAPADYHKPQKTHEKLYIPVKDYPDINFVGLLLGPRGNTLRQLQDDSGAKLAIRGKGSVKDGKSTANDDDDIVSFANPTLNSNGDDLHVVVSADTLAKIATAIKLCNEVIEKAISSPFGQNELKRGQLRELAVLNGTYRETKPYVAPTNKRPMVDISSIVCQNCGKVGHVARDCNMPREEPWKRQKVDLETVVPSLPPSVSGPPPPSVPVVKPPPPSVPVVKPPPPSMPIAKPPPPSVPVTKPPPPPAVVKPPPPPTNSVKPPAPATKPPPPQAKPPPPPK